MQEKCTNETQEKSRKFVQRWGEQDQLVLASRLHCNRDMNVAVPPLTLARSNGESRRESVSAVHNRTTNEKKHKEIFHNRSWLEFGKNWLERDNGDGNGNQIANHDRICADAEPKLIFESINQLTKSNEITTQFLA